MLLLLLLFLFTTLFVLSTWVVRDRVAAMLIRLYLAWWAGCLIASVLDPDGIYPVSDFAYFLLVLNVVMFTSGFMVSPSRRGPVVAPDVSAALARSFRLHVTDNRWVLVVVGILFVYYLTYYVRYTDALASLGPAEARTIRFTIGPMFSSVPEALVFNYFAEAFANALGVVIAYSLVLGTVRSWVFPMAVVDLGLFAGIGAGRTVVVLAGVFVLFLLLVRRTVTERASPVDEEGRGAPGGTPPRRKGILVPLLLTTVGITGFLIYLTYSRLFSVDSGLENLWDRRLVEIAAREFMNQVETYSIGPFRALDYAIQNPENFGVHYGRLTLGALDELIGYPLRLIGFDYPIMNEQIGQVTQAEIYIGSADFNALYTSVFRFYFDFGIPGVLLVPFAMGALTRGAVRLFNGSPSVPTLAIMLLLFGVAFLSMQTWHLSKPSWVLFLAAAYAFHRRTLGERGAGEEAFAHDDTFPGGTPAEM